MSSDMILVFDLKLSVHTHMHTFYLHKLE